MLGRWETGIQGKGEGPNRTVGSFSMLYFSSACVAQSMASCCMS